MIMACGGAKELVMTFSRRVAAAFLPVLTAIPLATIPIAAQASPPAVTIGVDSYKFTPNPILLKAGQPVTLTFVNQGGHGHDFTAKEFFAASTVSAGAAPGGKIELAGNETKSITLTPRAGTYPAHCSHFLHSSWGMTAQIVVN
jgi:plastocyanin